MRVRILTCTENAKQISSKSLTNFLLLVDWPCFSILFFYVILLCAWKTTWITEKTISNPTLSSLISFDEFSPFSNVFTLLQWSKMVPRTHHIIILLSYALWFWPDEMNEMKQYHRIYLSLLGICVQSTINNQQ